MRRHGRGHRVSLSALKPLAMPVLVAAFAGAICYFMLGPSGLEAALGAAAHDLGAIVPRIAAAVVLAAVIQTWLPQDKMKRFFGASSGLKGMSIAAFIGTITLGGPMTSFPLMASLSAAGVEIGCLVAFLTGWSLLAFQRIVVWEWPLLGPEFVAVRIVASIGMPVLAGLIARALYRPDRVDP